MGVSRVGHGRGGLQGEHAYVCVYVCVCVRVCPERVCARVYASVI